MKSKFLSSSLSSINIKLESVSKARLSVGLLILVCWFYPVIFSSGMALLYPSSLLLIVAFVVLVYKTARVREFKAYLLQREKMIERRTFQNQTDFKYTPDDLNRWGQLLAKMNIDKSAHWDDLDLVKPQGLLQAIHTTGNAESLQSLINLMRRSPLSTRQIQERQNRVKVLANGPRRKALALLTLNPESTSVNSTNVLLKESLVDSSAWVYAVYAYYVALIVCYVWFLISGATAFAVLLFGLFFIFPVANAKVKIFKTLAWVSGFEAQLNRLQKVKKIVHSYAVKAEKEKIPMLHSFLESTNGVSFEDSIQELNRIIGAMGLRQNVILYAIVHAIVPWDFYWTARAESLRLRLEKVYLRWVEDLVEFEAIALLSEYSANIVDGVWPVVKDAPATLTGLGLRHPLIPARYVVSNDVELNTTTRKCLLITGSNMSGKSTFLRTLGINLVLMRLGAKVHATQLEASPFQVLTSLKRVDSLEESLSTFYSEVKNLKEIRDECISHISIYLIDEIFRGTNNRERLIGAQKYIKALLQSPSIGLVTTHDLELSQMDQEYSNLVNEHFADTIENGKMIFDYKKKLGPCPSTNALKVMEMEGVF
ncbi:MAG: hypothetical protein B7Y39_01175 [Bdellovibrio sp. 28-41-41]|nr:MAG: hypothetical protein B7Y39_01175 [Bdellovibrio sp. 28-41-41]